MSDTEEKNVTPLSQREQYLQEFQNRVEALKREIAEKEASLEPLNQTILGLKSDIETAHKMLLETGLEVEKAKETASEIISNANDEAQEIKDGAIKAFEKLNAQVEGNRAVLKKNEEEYRKRETALRDTEQAAQDRLHAAELKFNHAREVEVKFINELDSAKTKSSELEYAGKKLDEEKQNLASLKQAFEETVLAHAEVVKVFRADVSEFNLEKQRTAALLAEVTEREADLEQKKAEIEAGLKSQEDARIFNDQRMADLDEFENSLKRKENALNEREAFLNKSREGK